MKDKEWNVFARVRAEDGSSKAGLIISDVSVTTNGIKKVLLNEPIEISTGKTKNHEGKSGSAQINISPTNPDINSVYTEGTGRVENQGVIGFPKLALGTKKNRKHSHKGLYAILRVKSEKEIGAQEEIQYFDLVIGRQSEVSRSSAPHFGFRPDASSHFYVKTNELGAEHKTDGYLTVGSKRVIPRKIVVICKNVSAEVVIKFSYEYSTNTVVAESIKIFLGMSRLLPTVK